MKKARRKKWPCGRTKQLVEFLQSLHPSGLTVSDLARDLRMAKPTVSRMLCSDNMHLSRAEYIAHIYGYELRLAYVYKGTYPVDTTYYPRIANNLYGIDEYCQRMNRTYHYIADTVGIHQNSIVTALKTGDIMLSTLYTITNGLGMEITWTFLPIE